MTEQALRDSGATLHHEAWARGYVSRKSSDRVASKLSTGRYKGLWIVRAPSWQSTRYYRLRYYKEGY